MLNFDMWLDSKLFFRDLKFLILVVEVISWLQYIWCRDLYLTTEDFCACSAFLLPIKAELFGRKKKHVSVLQV